jgi:hypothetical protein
MSELWRRAGVEPSLDELIADPIVGLLMRHDRIDEAELRRTLAKAGAALLEESEEFAADMAAASLSGF